MRAGISVVTPPTVEPLTLAQLKAWLRVDVDDDNGLIQEIGVGAREVVEERANVACATQTLDQVMDSFPGGNWPIELLRAPVQSITSIKYTDASGVVQTLSASSYISNLLTRPPRVAPAFGAYWPLAMLQPISAVTVRFVAGYGAAAAVPQRLRQAIYYLASHYYENRSPVIVGTISAEVQETLADLLAPFSPRQYA